MKQKILIIEDDLSICSFVSAVLTANGYDALVVHDGKTAENMITSHCPDLMILDLGLPDMNGMELIQYVRSWSSLPIVVVSARTLEREKVQALDLGADDYITKPFGTNELLARIRTALRHTHTQDATQAVARTGKFKTGELLIDYDKRRVYIRGEDARLTQNEFKIVAMLGKYAGKVLTYDSIMKEIWGPGSAGITGKTSDRNQILRVNMANIRRKIEKNPGEPEYIFTEVGVGYRMVEGESDQT